MDGPAATTQDHESHAGALIELGLEGASFETVLGRYCDALVALGVPLLRVHVAMTAKHPEFGGDAHHWWRGKGARRERFARSEGGPSADWLASPLYHLLQLDEPTMRLAVDDEAATRFPLLADLRRQGATDYVAAKVGFLPFPDLSEGMMVSWSTDAAPGFSDADIQSIQRLLPALSLAFKPQAKHQMAEDLLSAYLGADAGWRVLSGSITRGSVETVEAVILYFDLQDFTRLSETVPGPDLIAMLNAYFGAVVPVIEAHGGNVLKFMGDGLLAIFAQDDTEAAGLAAIDAVSAIRETMEEINRQRHDAGLQSTGFNAALHAGEVLYGNIGAPNRLDFTVIGPAVNTASRILGMCGPVGQEIAISARVARPALDKRPALVSLGSYRLRGVRERQELFTLD
ncbi:MAG: adenylate/guanylate cyclase domain-containing protein [Pseudooceanicola nanhaiensis]